MTQEIDQALSDLVAIGQRRKPGQVTHKIEEIKQIINQYVKEVIGKDEFGYGNKPDKQNAEQEIRSELRKEQRKRAGL